MAPVWDRQPNARGRCAGCRHHYFDQDGKSRLLLGNVHSAGMADHRHHDSGMAKVVPFRSLIGFIAAANKYSGAIANNQLLGPAQSIEEMKRIVLNNQIDAVLTFLFIAFLLVIIVDAARIWYKVLVKHEPLSAKEAPYVPHQPKTVKG